MNNNPIETRELSENSEFSPSTTEESPEIAVATQRFAEALRLTEPTPAMTRIVAQLFKENPNAPLDETGYVTAIALRAALESHIEDIKKLSENIGNRGLEDPFFQKLLFSAAELVRYSSEE